MKGGFTISTLLHAGVLACCVITFGVKPLETAPSDSLPVDLISLSDYSQLTAGVKTAKKVEAPKPVVEKVDDKKNTIDDTTAKVSPKQEIDTAQTPPPAPQKQPEPKPEQKADDKKPDPIAEALKKDDNKKTEQREAKVPTPPKRPPRPQPERPQPKFDAERIAALLDKREVQRHAATGATLNTTPTLGSPIGQAQHLSQNEIDALRAQIQRCWNPPAGAAEAQDLIVVIKLSLNQDGSVNGQPSLASSGSGGFFQVAAESAIRAIKRCQPYKLPIAKYDVWRDVEVTFDPRDMFRG